jgi:hypothetical protein
MYKKYAQKKTGRKCVKMLLGIVREITGFTRDNIFQKFFLGDAQIFHRGHKFLLLINLKN